MATERATKEAISKPDNDLSRTPDRPRKEFTPEELEELRRKSRLSMPAPIRIPVASFLSFGVGMCLGIAQGSKMAGLRFRAEHAHKLPTTTPGWFLYHKSKNYHVAFSSIKEGLKMGGRISVWTTAMFAIENMFDVWRGYPDAINTVLASVTVAGGFSLWHRFPLVMAARTTKMALIAGVAYGGLQDAVGFLRGRPISYVEYVRKRLGNSGVSNSMT
ncbi:hypothetical protein MCOR25_000255 [Pyricularia grisea]|uniref:Uncharacterized protein n=1 Tax=Pyricularia grisea TaxID=148305 RepID=A0A6P8APL3_PYRGI|nr:hypothetical protein PgNI_11421 [Pyricularia grisea]KAI6383068.1 hypothetical protein MCOR25_000255 [Pyricularia grisea]TLD03984.1 hypothetical protein PgNI_11421 [Pyricularia grisea]